MQVYLAFIAQQPDVVEPRITSMASFVGDRRATKQNAGEYFPSGNFVVSLIAASSVQLSTATILERNQQVQSLVFLGEGSWQLYIHIAGPA